MPSTERSFVREGSLAGALVWLAHAALESWLLAILPWLRQPSFTYRPLHLGMSLLLFPTYLACGAGLGALVGLGARRWLGPAVDRARTRLRAAAALTLVLGYAANAAVMLRGPEAMAIPLGNAALVAAALGWLIASPGAARRFGWLAAPWWPALLLLAGPWGAKNQLLSAGYVAKALAVLAPWLAVLAAAAFVRRRPEGADRPPSRPVPILVAAGLTLAVAALARARPHVAAAFAHPPSSAAKRPSIVLITMDTTRADHLSIYGYARDTTPNLRALAAGATLYLDAYSTADHTLPSHASLFTSRYPTQHGAHYPMPPAPSPPLGPGLPTLAALLARADYRTAAVVANHGFLGHGYGLDRGFEYFDQRAPVRILSPAGEQDHFLRQGVSTLLARAAGTGQEEPYYRRAGELHRDLEPLFARLQADARPFFLFVNYMDAHWPYLPPPPFDRMFPGRDPAVMRADPFSGLANDVLAGHRTVAPALRAHLVSQYDGGIAYVDHHIGRLIERLRALGRYDEALIVVTGDHGEAFGERGLIEHGVSVYQDQVRVPLVVKYPHQREGRVSRRSTSGVDILPTILAAVNLPPADAAAGVSLLDDAAGAPERTLIAESFPEPELFRLSPRFQRVERALFARRYKLVTSTAGKQELYDLEKDAGEQHDLARERPETVRELTGMLEAWLAGVARAPGVPGRLDPDTLNRLRSLGYVR